CACWGHPRLGGLRLMRTRRSYEIKSLNEGARGMPTHDKEDFSSPGHDLYGTSRARQSGIRVLPIGSDESGVEAPVFVDLGSAKEPYIDALPLENIGEEVGHRHHRRGPGHEDGVRDATRQRRWPGSGNARFVNDLDFRCHGVLRERNSESR